MPAAQAIDRLSDTIKGYQKWYIQINQIIRPKGCFRNVYECCTEQKASKLSERKLLILAPISESLHAPGFLLRYTVPLAGFSQEVHRFHECRMQLFASASVQAPVSTTWPAELQPSVWQISDQQEPPRPWWPTKQEAQQDANLFSPEDFCSVHLVHLAIESWWKKPAHDFSWLKCNGRDDKPSNM